MRGFVTLYLNTEVAPEGSDIQAFFDMVRNGNRELIENLGKEGYSVLFVPVKDESSRVEKIDLDIQSAQFTANAASSNLNPDECKAKLQEGLNNA